MPGEKTYACPGQVSGQKVRRKMHWRGDCKAKKEIFDRKPVAKPRCFCYNKHTELCRVGISVLQRLPKPLRRVRLPYPAPAQKFPPLFRFRLAAKTALWWEFLRFRPGFASLDSGPKKTGDAGYGLHLFCQHATARRKRHISCGDVFMLRIKSSSRAHSAAPLRAALGPPSVLVPS